MMNGTQKSDSPIVAVKPANKPEHLTAGAGAESVEPRGGAKGNAGQSRTCRTQSRESVFQRLDRVRQSRKAEEEGKVHRADAPR
jgi:RNA-directed DNA polymerase